MKRKRPTLSHSYTYDRRLVQARRGSIGDQQVLPGLPTNRPQCKPFCLNKFLSGVFVQFSQSTFLEEIEWLRFNMAKIYLPYGIWCKLVGSPKFRFFGLVSILCKISDAVDSANEEGERKECQKCHQKGPGETRWKYNTNDLLNSYYGLGWVG